VTDSAGHDVLVSGDERPTRRLQPAHRRALVVVTVLAVVAYAGWSLVDARRDSAARDRLIAAQDRVEVSVAEEGGGASEDAGTVELGVRIRNLGRYPVTIEQVGLTGVPVALSKPDRARQRLEPGAATFVTAHGSPSCDVLDTVASPPDVALTVRTEADHVRTLQLPLAESSVWHDMARGVCGLGGGGDALTVRLLPTATTAQGRVLVVRVVLRNGARDAVRVTSVTSGTIGFRLRWPQPVPFTVGPYATVARQATVTVDNCAAARSGGSPPPAVALAVQVPAAPQQAVNYGVDEPRNVSAYRQLAAVSCGGAGPG